MAVKIDLAKHTITLSVGDLVAEPMLNVGRVAGLSVWARMEMGRDVHIQHQRAQADLHEGYAREIRVRHETTVDEFAVTIQGRIDGVYPPRNGGPTVVEEIKSVVLPPLLFASLSVQSHPHYVEQLRLYCFFVTGEAAGRLVYINVAGGARKEIEIAGPFDDCAELVASRVRALIAQERAGVERRAHRKLAAANLRFPHDRPRRQQDEMIAAVERTLAAGRHLMVSAPSGTGKTAGALYPVMRHALTEGQRVFFVTAKNTQQTQALATLRAMATPSGVAFRAREKMCINNVYACREEFCPHLQMFALKLARSRVIERLLGQQVITPDDLIAAGQGVNLCPFELALLEAERTDAIVCDYNYVFDPQVYLRRFFQDEDYSDAILVIDEAHNLVQRALDYYSPALHRSKLRELSHQMTRLEPALARDFRNLLRLLNEFFERQDEQAGDEYSQEDTPQAPQFTIESPRAFFEELRPTVSKLAVRFMLDKITSGRAVADDPVEEFFAEFGQFCSVLAMAGEEFAYVYDRRGGGAVKVVCLDASRQLAERLAGFHSVIAMSATLAPMDFYRAMLGFDVARTDSLILASPFPPANRLIAVVPSVMTTYQRRAAGYGKIAEIIATTVAARRGNYMALFPSYDFLRSVAERLPEGDWETLVQEAKMGEPERQAVLDSLRSNEPPKLVMAVQGGAFAEGVDYPGEVLSGVIVVSPALPQVSYERELMRKFYDQRHGKGFEFAYLYPGMNRVIQSVGRLIRSETDRGVALLVCQRFVQNQYTALFPSEWLPNGEPLICRDLGKQLSAFWGESALHTPLPKYSQPA